MTYIQLTVGAVQTYALVGNDRVNYFKLCSEDFPSFPDSFIGFNSSNYSTHMENETENTGSNN